MPRAAALSETLPPPLSLLFGEAGVLRDWSRGLRDNARLAAERRGDGRPVLLLPGFLVSDERMRLLKRTLRQAGYQAHGWGLAQVITLGSPFSGSIRANNAWRLYQLVAGHPVDAPPIAARLAEKPPVPTYALWSRRDGIVAPASARGEAHERDAAIEVDCLHMGFACAPEATRAILDLLDQPLTAVRNG